MLTTEEEGRAMGAPERLHRQDFILDWDMTETRVDDNCVEYVRADLYERLRVLVSEYLLEKLRREANGGRLH
jgi:hypothetical protein